MRGAWRLETAATAFRDDLMMMKGPGDRALREIVCAVFAALSLTAATSASAADSFGADFYPFAKALSLPRDVPANTVVLEHI